MGEAATLVAAELVGHLVAGTVAVSAAGQAWPRLCCRLDLMRVPLFALSVAGADLLLCRARPGLCGDAVPAAEHPGVRPGAHRVAADAVAVVQWRWSRRWPDWLADRFPAAVLGRGGAERAWRWGWRLMATLPASPVGAGDRVADRAVCGLGFGFFNSPNNRAMIGSAPAHRSGGASGMVATARLLGQTTGAALVALCFEVAPRDGRAERRCWSGAAFAGAAALASLLRTAAPNQVCKGRLSSAGVRGNAPAFTFPLHGITLTP